MTETFATLLRSARRNARDPERGGQLTQERFAELVSQHTKRPGFPTSATVSNWERGKVSPIGHERLTICAVIAVLLCHRGLTSRVEADALLRLGGYAPLTDDEIHRLVHGSPQEEQALLLLRSDNEKRFVRPHTEDSQRQSLAFIAVRHQSMEQITPHAILPALSTELQGCKFVELTIDQCDLFHEGRLTDPRAAVYRQHQLEQQVAAMIADYPHACVAYYGIAHIPLIFLAGYTLSNRRTIRLFEFHRYEYTWNLLQRGGDMPPLAVTGIPTQVDWRHGEVVVKVGISFRVHQEDVAEVIPEPLASIELALNAPRLDSVTSEAQLRLYAQTFRQVMDTIHEQFPRAIGIHVFYAGPPSLAFLCGQWISKTIHPRVVVYNFVGKDRPKYSWGIDIMREVEAEDFVVRVSAVEAV